MVESELFSDGKINPGGYHCAALPAKNVAEFDRIVQRLTFLVQHLPEGAIQLNSSEFKDVISRNAPLGAPWADSPEVGAASTI